MNVGNAFPPEDPFEGKRGQGSPNVQVPHLQFPFQLSGFGNAVQLEQDSAEEIENCVALIASVPKGALVDEPEFGITDPTFMINPPTVLIEHQIKEWEPRVQITAVEAPNGEDMTLANIIVRVVTGTP